MDKNSKLNDYIRHSNILFLTSDKTLRVGQIFYQNAFNYYPDLEFDKITNTIYDPFYIDDNLPMFIEFLKKGEL